MVLIALEALLAVLGFASGITYLLDPSGGTHGMDTALLKTTPIGDFTLVGLFFVTCYGRTGPGRRPRLQESFS
jgi:hypothetical protein